MSCGLFFAASSEDGSLPLNCLLSKFPHHRQKSIPAPLPATSAEENRGGRISATAAASTAAAAVLHFCLGAAVELR